MTTGINLEDIMISEMNQCQKDKYWMILLMWDLWIVKFIESEYSTGCQGLEKRK
jgi:hypothetical protein